MKRRSTWLVQDIPVTGDATTLLANQAHITVPGKLIPGSQLRLELPMRAGRPPHASLLRTILDEWNAPMRAADSAETCADADATDILDQVGTALTGVGIQWRRTDHRLEWSASIDRHRYGCRATVHRSWLRLQCELLSLDATSPGHRIALAHYLVEANGRIQGSRASLTEQQLTVETILLAEEDELDGLFPMALAALRRAVSSAMNGAIWLQQDGVITRYLAFHGLEKGGERHDSSDRGLVRLARSR
ncbi:MAG: hypothetical protein MRJ68_11800 [Nitrospira sp.]|nr:hypothetical protein [Nitrospira sp.]